MKLAIVTAYPPSKVTLNEYAYHLVKNFRLKKEITEIVLLTDYTEGKKDLKFDLPGCQVSAIECWKFNSYKNLFSISKQLDRIAPDVVLFNLQFMKFGDKKIPAALGLMLPLVCKLKGLKNVVLLHNILEEVDLTKAGFANNWLMRKLYGFIGSCLTRLILQSDQVAVTIKKYVEVLEKKYKTSKVSLIPHGTFELPEEPNFEETSEVLRIMTFGKFGTYKKVEAMIDAVELVRTRTGKQVEIVIAGTDNPNVKGYLAGVQEQYQHVSDLVFTGYVEEKDVPGLFQSSAAVVFPYTSTTGSSGVLHQAGSYGKAVVMPDLGDLALLVKDEGYRGEFFDPHSTESLAQAIEAIVIDEEHRIALGKANYKAATAYPMSKIADMYLQIFDHIKTDKKEHLAVV